MVIDSGKSAIIYYGGFLSQSGGAFMHARAFGRELRDRGWQVRTITLDDLPLAIRYLPHVVAKALNMIASPLGLYYKGAIIRALFKALIARKPGDLLVFEDIYLAWNTPHPAVTILHAVWTDNLQAYRTTPKGVARLKRKEVARIRAIAHPVITVSQRYRAFLERTHFRDTGAVSLGVVELGLKTAAHRLAAPVTDPMQPRSLVYCGALEARKNVGFMLEVFARIRAEDAAATLTIIGDGPDRGELERHAARLGTHVAFLGRLPHDRVFDELRRHNIYIHTATKESFSFALLEAKLAGLTTCALASLEVPEEFIDIGFATFDSATWSSRILAITGRPDLTGFPDYSVARMTDRTLALVIG